MKINKTITLIILLLKPFTIFSNEVVSKESLIKEIILKKKSENREESFFFNKRRFQESLNEYANLGRTNLSYHELYVALHDAIESRLKSDANFSCNYLGTETRKIDILSSNVSQAISMIRIGTQKQKYDLAEVYELIPKIENEVKNDDLLFRLGKNKFPNVGSEERTWDTWLDAETPDEPGDHWDTWMDNHWDKYTDPDPDDDKPINPAIDSIDGKKPIKKITPIEFPNKREKINKK